VSAKPPRRAAPPRPPRARDAEDELEWVDRTYDRADLSNRVLTREELLRCTFDGCRMTGFQVPDGSLTDVRFTGCRIDLAALRHASLTRVLFEDCVLRELDLLEARMSDVRFVGCDLRVAEFGRARGSRLELEGCEVDGLRGTDGLRGALMPWPDVMGLLGPLAADAGLVVLEDA
jgi:uncharacterized protein YjbI with pentapeptide repeats